MDRLGSLKFRKIPKQNDETAELNSVWLNRQNGLTVHIVGKS